jgi:hypothetical protein
MGLHDPFEYLQRKLWSKKKVWDQNVNLIIHH